MLVDVNLEYLDNMITFEFMSIQDHKIFFSLCFSFFTLVKMLVYFLNVYKILKSNLNFMNMGTEIFSLYIQNGIKYNSIF